MNDTVTDAAWIASLQARIAELEVENKALQAMRDEKFPFDRDTVIKRLEAEKNALRELALFWINRGLPAKYCSEQEYNTWLALGHHSNALTKEEL